MTHFHGPQALVQSLREAIALHRSGKLSQARKKYQYVLTLDPHQPDALHLLGLIAHQQGKSQTGLKHIDEAIALRPDDADFHFNRANMLHDLQQLDAAIESFRHALDIQPENAQAWLGLGAALSANNMPQDAVDAYHRSIEIQPNVAQVHYNLGNVLTQLRRLVEAEASYRRALSLNPNDGSIYYNLGNALYELNRGAEALDCYRRALCLLDRTDDAFLALPLKIQWVNECSAADLFELVKIYADKVEAPLKPHWKERRNKRQPERRLRVGYVSGDFRRHPVAYFVEPIFESHDRHQFEVFAYYNSDQIDDYTERIRAHCDHWIEVHALGDDDLERRVRADGIDILVDLSGFTAGHRLPVFARKPSPVQVTWFGFIGSTGLSAMDYRITNAFMDPPGLTERYHSEALVRLPATDIAYRPVIDCPEVNLLPALSGKPFTLGSLNNSKKLNHQVIALWARVLKALPSARLMLGGFRDDKTLRVTQQQFQSHGIDLSRIQIQPEAEVQQYMELHQQIDLGLDPFPYNGGATTIHALWMGVPVVTLEGRHSVARWGVAALNRVGLPQFICQTEVEYVQCVQRWAADLPALNAVRQELRGRMQAESCSGPTITRNLEAAYREMWRSWCQKSGASHESACP